MTSNANDEWLEFVKSTKAFVTVPVAEWEEVRRCLEIARERMWTYEREAFALKLALLPETGGDWQYELDKAMRKGICIAREKGIRPPGPGLYGCANWGHLSRLFPNGVIP